MVRRLLEKSVAWDSSDASAGASSFPSGGDGRADLQRRKASRVHPRNAVWNKEESIIHRTSLKAKIVSFTQRKRDRAARHVVSG